MRTKVSKRVIYAVLIILLLLIAFLSCFQLRYYIYSGKVHSFAVEDYAENISRFSADDFFDEGVYESSGRIDNIKDAKDYADKLLREIYGKSIKNEKPYIVQYDSVNKAWHVKGSLNFFARLGLSLGDTRFKGSVVHIIFNESDGQILAVWHDK